MNERNELLVVDDDPSVLEWLLEALSERGFAAEGVSDPVLAIERIGERSFDLVISDIEMPQMRGLELVRRIHASRPDQLIILITAFGSIELAMECVRTGAADFLAKPFSIDALTHAIERTLRERRMRREIVRLRRGGGPTRTSRALVAKSDAMKQVLELASRAASSSSTVLLTGESGVGKSAVARFIHDHGARAEAELVQLNCAALPAGLVEAELFGVRRGAFTDAREDRAGLIELADGGSLFLDEIGDMALEVQPKLLVALERRSFRPVGANREMGFDVRVIAATNRPPEEAVQDGRLRADLFHRLNVLRIEIPPLRQRAADIPPLVDQMLAELAQRSERNVRGVSEDALRWLCHQPWAGNVRELANTLERAVMLGDHDVLLLEDFLRGSGGSRVDALNGLRAAAARGVSLAEMEGHYIQLVLDQCDGNKAKAARVLGIDRTTLWRRLSQGS